MRLTAAQIRRNVILLFRDRVRQINKKEELKAAKDLKRADNGRRKTASRCPALREWKADKTGKSPFENGCADYRKDNSDKELPVDTKLGAETHLRNF
ncbi:hypothetical protein JCM17844_17820 [Iodidimonas gelatinilytica]|uniref:Uncharacterized protein n=1 Tax=Iodidimonas gelatinilytica TaxID=1236966 RepID=A0A5A7MT57_9PROT|nr:hypothetical protein JCM17844_17820 [Iodidimonas gelatinilytica]